MYFVKTKALRADLLLLLVSAIWGFAFVAQIKGMDHLGPFSFNAVRFAFGVISLLPVYFLLENVAQKKSKVKKYDNDLLFKWGPLTGVVLFLASSFQQVGLLYTTAGNSGFITGFYIILVPILGIGLGHTTRPATWIGGAFALAGLYFLTVKDDLSLNKGDLLTMGSALMYAIQILLIGWLARNVHPLRLSLVQFSMVALCSLLVALATEVITLDAIAQSMGPLLFTGVLSTGVAFTLQTIAQKDAASSHAAIIMSLEAVFAVIGGWLLLNEQLGTAGILGCTLMMVGMLLSQLRRKNAGQLG
ncbi:DMT family transporter [Endozoicomonas ascidiicola]|uniref:DMT family transporter n=1 Tax=Endozoicomonas ascidiicola TaxID=1698521 RepID=UPI000B2FE6F8|nr:DMT family transporter [Endozoicomonas ascidiicola]